MLKLIYEDQREGKEFPKNMLPLKIRKGPWLTLYALNQYWSEKKGHGRLQLHLGYLSFLKNTTFPDTPQVLCPLTPHERKP